MLALVGRSVVGSVIAPTVDFFRGEDVGFKDYVPFGHLRDEGYDMDDFAKDVGYTAVGATIAASPQIVSFGSAMMLGETVPIGLSPGILPAAAVVTTVVVGTVATKKAFEKMHPVMDVRFAMF